MLIIFQEGSEQQILDESATPEKPAEDSKMEASFVKSGLPICLVLHFL